MLSKNDIMKRFSLLVFVILLLFACGPNVQNDNQSGSQGNPKTETKKTVESQFPTLNVYNMGDVPQKDIDDLVQTLKTVYPNTRYVGDMTLVDSAHIKNDIKGNNRYWWSKLCMHLKRTTDYKHGITLVIVNADICNWDKKSNGSHANLGVSNCGGHISTISYQRLKVNHLNNNNDLMKVVIHELGHSVAGLVAERADLRSHCPDTKCLMRDAKNGYPYRGLTSFCPSCSNALKAKGFNLDALQLKK